MYPDQVAFMNTPSDSVDYTVLEKGLGSGPIIKIMSLVTGWNSSQE